MEKRARKLKKARERTPEDYALLALRRLSYQWPARNEAFKRARKGRGVYECAHCKKLFHRNEVQADHINPIVPVTGFDSFDNLIKRLYCPPEGFQILCKEHHKEKTGKENSERRKHRKPKSNSGSKEPRKKRV